MSTIPIQGANKATYDSTTTDAKSSKGPFPFNANTWSNYTATVTEVTLQIDESEDQNDQIVVKAENGNYGVRFYVGVDPLKVGPNCTDVPKAVSKNLDKLLLIGKALGILVTKGESVSIDTSKFPQAAGKVIAFGIIQAQDRNRQPKVNAKGYAVPAVIFNGLAQKMVPVIAPVTTPPTDEDIPVPF